ncbi:alpha-mannosidase [Paenibacillus catalpae]|uniref:Alpha-mannosidase n=1 Tax=Paenibacillus catalpae TaxID=1045775 RepID=A0A1I1YIZ1_9BACL|nr:glycoside hydrolase family 38 C-terminal domain-containing protein [Paenibacillus catalpae]SFE19008.1 alpha-mannosidase [Paenibacillus catalpae]
MKNKKLYMIGNAHLDPVWLWQWQEGFQEAKATFRSALDRMKESEDFIFTSSSAAMYEWIENNDPDMFKEIQARVSEGRWNIVGGWWIQPDCNIPSGESFVRQGLYGQRYFKEKFGVTARVGYNVDSFGHNGMLPQILKKSGMDYYVMMRPMPNEKGLPGRTFWWQSDDGSKVLTFRIMYEYLSWGKDLENHVRRCLGEFKEPLNDLMLFYGVGNHGGGPTKENIASIRRMNGEADLPKLEFATPDQYFDDMVKSGLSFPVVHDDLQHHASGCYAAHSGIKQWNRQAENRLIAAEKFSALASWVTGQPYPLADLSRAWKNVLFNQFHDILAGTSLEAAYEDARYLFGEAMAIADRSLNYAVQSLSWNIGIEQDESMHPIVVFNPHAWQSRVDVELEVGGMKDSSVLLDDAGNPVPFQTVKSQAAARGRYRLSFMADLPPLGYRVYKLVKESASIKPVGEPITASDLVLENDLMRLEFDKSTGFIKSLKDKALNFEVMKDGARPVVIEDTSDTWSHDVLHFNGPSETFKATKVLRIEHGPVKSVIRVVSEYGSSKLVQDFAMYPGSKQIDVSVSVDWREKFKMLKLVFPVNVIFSKQTYEIPYGTIEREHNGEEEPGQNWVDYTGIVQATNDVYGLSLMNDAKYSYSMHAKEMALTVLRSPIYAHHDPYVPDADGEYSFIDQGIQHFNYSLLPHEGTWEQAGTVRRASELNCKPVAVIETFHEGKLPQTDSFVSVDKDNIIVSAIKKAEDNDDLILRCYETDKRATSAEIKLPKWNRVIRADFNPSDIKTFRVPMNADLPVTETSMLEWELE